MPTDKTQLPNVIRLQSRPDHARYRLIGGTLAPDWLALVERHGEHPAHVWCEISVFGDGADRRISSYGGVVWPGAWPSLFTFSTGTAQSGPRTDMTAECLALLDAADAYAEKLAAEDEGEPTQAGDFLTDTDTHGSVRR